MPRYTIDRFEGGERVALEDERAQTFRFPDSLPADVHEGDVLSASEERTANNRCPFRDRWDNTALSLRLGEPSLPWRPVRTRGARARDGTAG
jgi:hypothetical protein